jgi:hypothetical protein
MQLLNVTNLPIYLPYDTAPLPFGDPIEGITCTSAAPGVITAQGYAPTLNDTVQFTFLAGGSIPSGLSVGTNYYVVSPVGNTFSVSLTKGGAAITTASTGANLVLHLVSGEVDGVPLPFKPTNTAVALNLSAGTLVLQSAPDASTTGVYGQPAGPGTWTTLKSLAAGTCALVTLNNDWLRVSTAGTIVLLQN